MKRTFVSAPLRARLALAVTTLCALEFAADAEDVVTQPYEGVKHIARTTTTPNRIHIVEVDLANPRIRLRATRPADRQQVVSAFATEYGCQVAVNGDFFSYETYSTTGLAIGHGELWPDSANDNTTQGFVAFGRDNQVAISPPATVAPVEDWMSDVVSGRPLVVKDGAAVSFPNCTGYCARNPRTSVGMNADGTRLWLVTVDGRAPGVSEGVTLNELAGLMRGLGAHTALNLDGGGSTTMYVKNQGGLQNSPSDGSQRVVANHLGVCVVPPHGTLRGYVRKDDIYDETAGLAGVTVTLSTGASAVTDADGVYQLAEVPRGDVTITATADGFATGERSVYVTAADTTWGSIALSESTGDEEDEEEDPPGDDAGVDDGAAGTGELGGGCAASSNGGGGALLMLVLVALSARIHGRRRTRRR